METQQIFCRSPNCFEHVDDCTYNPYLTSLGHFHNQNVHTTKDSNHLENLEYFKLEQNSTKHSIQLTEQISLSKYSKPSINTHLQNTFNNYCNEFAKFNIPQSPDNVIPLCSDVQSDFNSTQKVGIQNCLDKVNPSNIQSLLYEHTSCINSERQLDQSYNTDKLNPPCKNSAKMQHNIKPTLVSKTIPLGVDKSNFNKYPHVQMDKGENSNMASIHVDPYHNHWYDLGMGRMKMECWELIVFYRNHSIYVNTSLMAESLGISTLLIRRLVGSKAISERMTQLEVSILRYIKYLSPTSHDTGLIYLTYFLNTLYTKLNDNKPNQSYIKFTIKTFIERLHSGFIPAISNIPYDLSSFFHFDHFNKTQDVSENSLKQIKIVSHLVLKNKSFSVIEYNGDFYMHLGEMVSNGLFPNINLVRRKIRKMHIQTKWLDSVESKYLNLSQKQELIRFSDLRVLCGLILYLHPNMQTDLLQMFSVMDLPNHISTPTPVNNKHFGPVKYTQNCLPIENTARKELQYQVLPNSYTPTANNKKQFLLSDSLQTNPTLSVEHLQREVTPTPFMKNLQYVDSSVQMEKLGQNDEFRNENHNSIMEKNVPERKMSVLPEEKIVSSTNFFSDEPMFMNSIMNSRSKIDILDVAFRETLGGALDSCSTSDIASTQILCRFDEQTKSDEFMTPEIQRNDVYDFTYKNQDKYFESYPKPISVLSENLQIEKGNDKLPKCVNENSIYDDQSLKNKSIFQIPEIFQKYSVKESQIEQNQSVDSIKVANFFSLSGSNFGSTCTAKPSKLVTGSEINIPTDIKLSKKQTDPPNISKFKDGSNIDRHNAFKSQCYTLDKNQSKQLMTNPSITIHSNIFPPPATFNANKTEIPTSSMVNNSSQICNDQIRISSLNTAPLGNEDKPLYTLPHITLLNSDQSSARSFQEPEKEFTFAQKSCPLTMPNSKSPYFSSKYSQNEIFRNQDHTLQDEYLLPSISHCKNDHVSLHNSFSTNSSLLSSNSPVTINNTPFQSLQIKDFSSQSMLGSFDKSGNIPHQTSKLSGNESHDCNEPTTSKCVSFQVQKTCDSDDAASKSKSIFSENLEKNYPIIKDLTSAKITSCSKMLFPVNNTALVNFKDNCSSLCTDKSKCEQFKESSTSTLFSEEYSKIQKSTPNILVTCVSNSVTISSPATASCQFTVSSPSGTDQTNLLSTNPANNLDPFIIHEKLPESRESALNTLEFKSRITLQKSQEQETTCQHNVPSITSPIIQRSNKDQLFEKLLNEKTEERNNQKESRSDQMTSDMQNNALEIASMAPVDTSVMETNEEALCNCVSQNIRPKDNCHFESGIKKFKYISNDTPVAVFNSTKKVITESDHLNKQNYPSLILNTATTHHNNQFHEEISDMVCLNNQNSLYSVMHHKQNITMETDIIKSFVKVLDKENQSIKSNTTQVKKVQCQKILLQNEGKDSFSSGYNPMKKTPMTRMSKFNMKCTVLNKHEKKFNSCTEITSISMGSMKYASSSPETKIKNICEYNFSNSDNHDILFPSLTYQTTAKQISVLDFVNVIKLYITGNRLHLDVAITDQAKVIFENKNKNNQVQPEKIFLQQLANDCCHFAKCWFSLYPVKSLDSENTNCITSIFTGRYFKTKTGLTFQKNMCTNHDYQSDIATRDRNIQMPLIFDSAILSCKCSKKLCGIEKNPENETSKKRKINLKGKISKTSDIFNNVIKELPCESDPSHLVLLKETKDYHDTCIDSSKLCEIAFIEQMPQKKTKCCQFGFRNKSRKRKISYSETGLLKKTKCYAKAE